MAAQLINLYPLPNGSGIANNYTGNNLREQDHQTMDARIDHRFNDNNTVFARYSLQPRRHHHAGLLPAGDG